MWTKVHVNKLHNTYVIRPCVFPVCSTLFQKVLGSSYYYIKLRCIASSRSEQSTSLEDTDHQELCYISSDSYNWSYYHSGYCGYQFNKVPVTAIESIYVDIQYTTGTTQERRRLKLLLRPETMRYLCSMYPSRYVEITRSSCKEKDRAVTLQSVILQT